MRLEGSLYREGGGGDVFVCLQVDGPMTEGFKSGQKSVRLRYPSRLTFIGFEVLQQTDLSEMLRCWHRKRHGVTYGLMECWVSTVTVYVRLVPEWHEVVDVAHLMMCRLKPVLRYLSTLVNPEKTNKRPVREQSHRQQNIKLEAEF